MLHGVHRFIMRSTSSSQWLESEDGASRRKVRFRWMLPRISIQCLRVWDLGNISTSTDRRLAENVLEVNLPQRSTSELPVREVWLLHLRELQNIIDQYIQEHTIRDHNML